MRLGRALVVLLFATPAIAASTSPIVRLYEERLNLARIEEKKAVRMIQYLEETQAILEDGEQHGTIPGSSVLEINRQLAMARATKELLSKGVPQAETLLRIAKERAASHLEMPYCFKD